MARIVWTDRARDSLREISDFIATDAPERAREVARRIFASVGERKDFPNMGRKVPELDRDDIRELVTGNYRVVYRNSQDTVLSWLLCMADRTSIPSGNQMGKGKR